MLHAAERTLARSKQDESAGGEEARQTRITKLADALRRLDELPKLVVATKMARELLPGDSEFGDPLSTAGSEPSQQLGKRMSALTAERPSLLGEVGLSALQVWQSISQQQTGEVGEREMAILFTDLVDFSSWSLEAGDAAAIELLRQVGTAIEPAVTGRGGVVVKRLGDGLMAAFDEAGPAVDAAVEAGANVAAVEVDGYRPAMRAGIHIGRPRRLGGDYLGTDVNIAARVAEAAGPGEVLVSSAVREQLGEQVKLKRRRGFRAKGAPKELQVYAVRA
jgi:adenylate cyclase